MKVHHSNMKFMDFLLLSVLFIGVLSFPQEQAEKLYCVMPTIANSDGSCSKLAFYMQNVGLHFTSNTEMNFMTGEHHLNSLLSVSNVTKLSLTGELNVTIRCHNTYILIANSASVEIKNIRFINCGRGNKASLILHNVMSFRIINTIFQNCFGYALIGTNIQGNSYFENIKIFQDTTLSQDMNGIIKLLFQETTNKCFQEANILIRRCRFINIILQETSSMDDFNLPAIKFSFCQQNYPAKIQIEDTTLANITSNGGPLVDVSYSNVNRNDSQVIFLNSNFINNNNKHHSTIEINILLNKQRNTKYLSQLKSTEKLPQWSFFLLNCKLHNNTSELRSILNVYSPMVEYHIDVSFTMHINLTNFTRNKAKEVLSNIKISNYSLSSLSHFVISRCTFASNIGFGLEFDAITYLTFDGLNKFQKNYAANIVLLFNRTIPLFIGENKFSRNIADIIMHIFKYISLTPSAELIFSNNIGLSSVNRPKYILYVKTDTSLHPCIFQFTRHSDFDGSNKIDNSINFNKNVWYSAIIFGASLNSCYWANDCMYANTTITPGDVYGYIIHYSYDNNLVSRTEATLCYCQDNITYDCIEDRFNPIQASRTVSLKLKLINSNFSTAVYINSSQVLKNTLVPACDLPLPHKMFEMSQECTTISYSIISNLTGMCSLYLTTTDFHRPVYVYYVTLQKCPLGFVFLDGKCDCDPVLTRNIPYMKCNPENSSILHGPKSWIAMTEDETDYLYKPDCISYHCSHDFFFMQFKNPDVQCLHNRTGLICGHCPMDLDAMLGSLQCGKCSNYWLLLVPVFLIIGIILVLALFVLNLTVVEGKINGFIFYTNVLNTFMYKIFPVNSIAFVAVSLANLDWGIETCFYHGMTEYAKVWLRFAFPVYLFFIVLVIIYASRYSQRIEKLTRRRVIPVIATIFLLSYNKILLVTNTALFYYVKVHKLRNNEIFRVWGLDTSVPLFGARFLMLFVTCLLIFFLILVPTNILLLFTKLCYRSQLIISHLKPFLDAYHAPIKEKHHSFLGVEFLVRAITFILGNNLLDVYEMLAISVLLLLAFSSYFCAVQPFKKTINNIIYMIFVYFVGLISVLNVAFQFKKNSSYVLLFNLFFAIPFVLFLGILCYHAHKYILQDSKTYHRYFTFAKDFIAQCSKQAIQKYCNPDTEHQCNGIPTGEDCELQEELLAYEN